MKSTSRNVFGRCFCVVLKNSRGLRESLFLLGGILFLKTNTVVGIEEIEPPTYYDQYGNEITEEEAKRRTLEDRDGNVVCEYVQRNENVCRISYSPKEGTALPIRVYTYDALEDARATAKMRHGLFIIGYGVELVLAAAFYFARKKR